MVAIMEIWKDGTLAYLVLELDGNFIPQQSDMLAREEITEVIGLEHPDFKVLDLIGIYDEGIQIWHERY